jgi:membrane-associated phospholipid phosphatase
VRALPPLAFLCAFLLTFGVALHTQRGLHDDAALFRHVSGTDLLRVQAAGGRALEVIDIASVVVAAIVVALLAVARGRVVRAAAAVAVVGLSIATAEALKHLLPTPADRPPTFPSGHVAVAASLGLALVFAVPSVLRPLAALGGAAWAAGLGLAVAVRGWHYPSDVVGAFAVAGFWASVVAAALRTRVSLSYRGSVVAVAAAAIALVLAAILAGRHPEAAAALRTRRALVGTTIVFALVSLATFGLVTPLAQERE